MNSVQFIFMGKLHWQNQEAYLVTNLDKATDLYTQKSTFQAMSRDQRIISAVRI